MSAKKYDKILNESRPVPIKTRMELSDRAKIFSPFAALRGYGEKIGARDEDNMREEDLSLERIRESNNEII